MAGLDKDFDGVARPKPGAKIGYLAQEPVLEGLTVKDCIDPAVKESREVIEEYNEISVKLGETMDEDEVRGEGRGGGGGGGGGGATYAKLNFTPGRGAQ